MKENIKNYVLPQQRKQQDQETIANFCSVDVSRRNYGLWKQKSCLSVAREFEPKKCKTEREVTVWLLENLHEV
jgi:hypothetical protein